MRLIVGRLLVCGVVPLAVLSGAGQRSAGAAAPTRVVDFTPPASLPAEVKDGRCWTTSIAAGYRPDAFRCMVVNAIYDPCFTTSRTGQVFCSADPRRPSTGVLVKLTEPLPPPSREPAGAFGTWFFELDDGSTCRPLTGTRRELDGQMEIYACAFTSPGDTDAAILGDLDVSTSVWTVQKVQLNKKALPPTVKSVIVEPVKTAWR